MWPDTQLLDLLSIKIPIIQAPMVGSSSPEMAGAVSRAGGLGSLACATMDADELRMALITAQSNNHKPFNVNFFAHTHPTSSTDTERSWVQRISPYYQELNIEKPKKLSAGSIIPFDDERCQVLEASPPKVVSFHFGLPAEKLVHRLKNAGIRVICSATTVDEAKWLEKKGCDAIIAQGYEAGGHRGMFLTTDVHTQMGTLSLVPQIVDAVNVPIIAAGGICDGRTIAAAFALGASGVQLGTAYLFTEEANISDVYRDTLHSKHTQTTAITNVFSGRPTRCVMNRFMQEQGPLTQGTPAFPKGFSAMTSLRIKAEQQGDRDFSPHFCGQSAALGKVGSANQLTRDLAADALYCLQRLAS